MDQEQLSEFYMWLKVVYKGPSFAFHITSHLYEEHVLRSTQEITLAYQTPGTGLVCIFLPHL